MLANGGDPKWIGWDASTELAADRFDQFALFAAGLGGGSADQAQLYPRPGMPTEAEQTTPGLFAETIDDFDIDLFMKALTG